MKSGVKQCGECSWKKSFYYLYEAQRSVQIHTVHATDINHNLFLVGWLLSSKPTPVFRLSMLIVLCDYLDFQYKKQLLNKYNIDRSLFPVLIFCILAPGFILWHRCAKTMNWENLRDYIGIKKKRFQHLEKVWIHMLLLLNFMLSVAQICSRL